MERVGGDLKGILETDGYVWESEVLRMTDFCHVIGLLMIPLTIIGSIN